MRDFLLALLACSASMSALGLVLMAITPLLAKRYAAKTQYILWLVILVGLLIPCRPYFDHALEADAPVEAVAQAEAAQEGEARDAMHPMAAVRLAETGRAALLPPRFPLWQLLFALWGAGAVVAIAYRTGKHIRFVRATHRWREEIADGDAFQTLQSLRKEMGMTGRIRLFHCPCVPTPMATGLIRHRVLLPSMEYDAEDLRYILLHELTHIRRRDLWYKVLTILATAIHWFNPAVYLIGSRADLLCEISCDSEIVRGADADARMSYTEALIGVVKRRTGMKTALSTDFYGGKDGMRARISSIMDTGKKRAGLLLICGVFAVIFGTGFLLPPAPPTLGEAREPLTADILEPIIARMDGAGEGLELVTVSHPTSEGQINMDEAIAIAKTSVSRYVQQFVVQGVDDFVSEMATDSGEMAHSVFSGQEEMPEGHGAHDFWSLQLRCPGVASAYVRIHAQTGLVVNVMVNLEVDADAEVSLERLVACYLEDLGADSFVPSGEDYQTAQGFTGTILEKDIVGGAAKVVAFAQPGILPPTQDDGFTTLAFVMDLLPPDWQWPIP